MWGWLFFACAHAAAAWQLAPSGWLVPPSLGSHLCCSFDSRPQAIVHAGWIDLHGRLVQGYDPTLDKPQAFDLGGVNRWALWVGRRRCVWCAGWAAKPHAGHAAGVTRWAGGRRLLHKWNTAACCHGPPLRFCPLHVSALSPHPTHLPPRRFTWLAARREPWTPERHRQWPPCFRAAVQHLLLLHHAGRAAATAAPIAPAAAVGAAAASVGDGGGDGGPVTRAKRARLEAPPQQGAAPAAAAAAPAAARRPAAKARRGKAAAAAAAPQAAWREPAALASLPPELVHRIISEAAYPISAWV